MRARVPALLLLVPALLAGCTSGPATRAAPPDGAPRSVPPPAGESEAAIVAGLPDGDAAGRLIVDYDGLGELRAPFTGVCRSSSGTTTISGTADTASVVVVVGADGGSVTVEDQGLRQESVLGQGDYSVQGADLALHAPLSENGVRTGDVDLDITCA